MLSKIMFVPLACAMSIALSCSVVMAQGYTTRIEPRPFYGATVTLEEGVRVIRPLPPERQVIINPGNATPLSLGFNDTHVYENRMVRNYNYSDGANSNASAVGRMGYRGGASFYGPGANPNQRDNGGHEHGEAHTGGGNH